MIPRETIGGDQKQSLPNIKRNVARVCLSLSSLFHHALTCEAGEACDMHVPGQQCLVVAPPGFLDAFKQGVGAVSSPHPSPALPLPGLLSCAWELLPCGITSARPGLNALRSAASPVAQLSHTQPVFSRGRVHSHIGRVLQAGAGVCGRSPPVQPHRQSHLVHYARQPESHHPPGPAGRAGNAGEAGGRADGWDGGEGGAGGDCSSALPSQDCPQTHKRPSWLGVYASFTPTLELMLLPQEGRPGPCRSKRTQENLLARTSRSPCLWCLGPTSAPNYQPLSGHVWSSGPETASRLYSLPAWAARARRHPEGALMFLKPPWRYQK